MPGSNESFPTSTDQWYLTLVYWQPDEDEGQGRTTINALELICATTVDKEKALISEYYRSLQLIRAVQLNIHELIESIVRYAADFLETRDMEGDKFDEISLNFSRQFLNILGMFRSFIDHSDYSLSRDHGKDSAAYKTWKQALSHQFDSAFEYRFFYKLRNYCQHIGMPPMGISYADSAEKEGVSFRLDIFRDQLLAESFSWGTKLLADLVNGPEKISVVQTLNDWNECFRVIAVTLLQIKSEAAAESARRITSHRSRLGLPETLGKLCVTQLPNTKEKLTSLNLRLAWLPEDKARDLLDGVHLKDLQRPVE